jgi:hypothetical protein
VVLPHLLFGRSCVALRADREPHAGFCQVSVLFSRPSGYRIVAIYERVSSFSSENFSDLAAMPTGMSEIF